MTVVNQGVGERSVRLDERGRRRLGALYDELLPVVFGYARGRLPEPEAEDVTAEVFRAAAQRLAAEPDADLRRGWFLAATRSRVIDRWRHRTRWDARIHVLWRDAEVSPDGRADHDGRVLAALDRLSAEQRAVIVLRYVEGLSSREIGDVVDRSPTAVDSLVARARRALCVAWEEVSA